MLLRIIDKIFEETGDFLFDFVVAIFLLVFSIIQLIRYNKKIPRSCYDVRQRKSNRIYFFKNKALYENYILNDDIAFNINKSKVIKSYFHYKIGGWARIHLLICLKIRHRKPNLIINNQFGKKLYFYLFVRENRSNKYMKFTIVVFQKENDKKGIVLTITPEYVVNEASNNESI